MPAAGHRVVLLKLTGSMSACGLGILDESSHSIAAIVQWTVQLLASKQLVATITVSARRQIFLSEAATD
jgi:hypothetical protein